MRQRYDDWQISLSWFVSDFAFYLSCFVALFSALSAVRFAWRYWQQRKTSDASQAIHMLVGLIASAVVFQIAVLIIHFDMAGGLIIENSYVY